MTIATAAVLTTTIALTSVMTLTKNNAIYTNTLLMYLINTVVHYCNH